MLNFYVGYQRIKSHRIVVAHTSCHFFTTLHRFWPYEECVKNTFQPFMGSSLNGLSDWSFMLAHWSNADHPTWALKSGFGFLWFLGYWFQNGTEALDEKLFFQHSCWQTCVSNRRCRGSLIWCLWLWGLRKFVGCAAVKLMPCVFGVAGASGSMAGSTLKLLQLIPTKPF